MGITENMAIESKLDDEVERLKLKCGEVDPSALSNMVNRYIDFAFNKIGREKFGTVNDVNNLIALRQIVRDTFAGKYDREVFR